MSFLNKLKNIGFGNRGPYGRQQTGASYLTEQLDETSSGIVERGWNKAQIAASTKDGKPKKVSPQEIIEISDKWGVPMQEVMNASAKINQNWEGWAVENFGKHFTILMEDRIEKCRGDKACVEKAMKESEKEANVEAGLPVQ